MYRPLAMYSFSTSFCTVPVSLSSGIPLSSATTVYIANKTGAGALIVIEVLTLDKSIPSNNSLMSTNESMGTPTLPTSPMERGSSESSPN